MESIGQVNKYICEQCRAVHGTVNLNTGTTPFLIRCQAGCNTGMAQSLCYNLPPGSTGAGWCWYRPNPMHFARLPMVEQEHILRGGLILGDFQEVLGCSTNLVEREEETEMLESENIDLFISYMTMTYLTRYPDRMDMNKQGNGFRVKNAAELFQILTELKAGVDNADNSEA